MASTSQPIINLHSELDTLGDVTNNNKVDPMSFTSIDTGATLSRVDQLNNVIAPIIAQNTSAIPAASTLVTNNKVVDPMSFTSGDIENTGEPPKKISAFKVTLSVTNNGKIESVVFQASSTVSESRTANYQGYDIVHAPTDIWAYRNTAARHYGIAGKLVSRTPDEADANAYYLNLIRKWLLPDFGKTGATPPICNLSAYGNQNINNLQVILRSYAFSFPDDVDYINMTNLEPMPVIMIIQLDVEEAYSGEQITAGAWKIKPGASLKQFALATAPSDSSGGALSGLLNSPTSSFSGLASGNFNLQGVNSLGSLLDQTLGVHGPTFSNPLTGLISSASSITQPMSGISSIMNNPLINGAKALFSNNPTTAFAIPGATGLGTITATTRVLSDPFGKGGGLSLPSFIS